MNPETLVEIQNKILHLEELVLKTNQVIKRIEIDNQSKLKSNKEIPPGVAVKVAYDKNGLIINGYELLASDIPLINIDGIRDLRILLEDKISKSEFKSLIDNYSFKSTEVGEVVATGCKVNYDDNGRIVSSADLSLEDLPELRIENIIGLDELIDSIKSQITSPVINIEDKDIQINPGTFTKISYDENGHVISGSNLSDDDIPISIINRINELESKLPEFATNKSVESINKLLIKKLDSNASIKSGTYYKVSVDSNGLVLKGEESLMKKDLPELSIDDIVGLDFQLRSKANQEDLITLNETISTILSNMDKIGNVLSLKSLIETKAKDEDVKLLTSRVESMQNLMNVLSNKIPNELIMEQLQQIQNDLSTLSGRITVIEKKMNIENSFK